MTPKEFIEQAISDGERRGLQALDPRQQVVYAIAEAEVYCNKDGVDALIDRYGKAGMALFSKAFLAVGASEIAARLQAIADADGTPDEEQLSDANRLITDLRGYSYEAIEAFVARGVQPSRHP